MIDNALTIGDLKTQTKEWTKNNGAESATIEVTERKTDARFTLHYKFGGENKEWAKCERKTKLVDFKKKLGGEDDGKVFKMTFLDGTNV
jgi:hypothetical protein